MCDHRLHDGPLTCNRLDPHEHGHTYGSTTGSEVPSLRHEDDGGDS